MPNHQAKSQWPNLHRWLREKKLYIVKSDELTYAVLKSLKKALETVFMGINRHFGPYTNPLSGKIKKNRKKFFHDFRPLGATPAHPHISAQGQNLKNRLDRSISILITTFHAKLQVPAINILICRGSRFEKRAAHLLFGRQLI